MKQNAIFSSPSPFPIGGYSGTSIERGAEVPGKLNWLVILIEVLFQRTCWRILFVIPRTLLYRGSLNRGITAILKAQFNKK